MPLRGCMYYYSSPKSVFSSWLNFKLMSSNLFVLQIQSLAMFCDRLDSLSTLALFGGGGMLSLGLYATLTLQPQFSEGIKKKYSFS